MINKIFKYIKNDIKNNYKFYIVMLIITLMLVIRLDYVIYSPGGLIDLTDRIEVDNSYESKGSFNLTYVTSRRGTIFNILISYLIPTWDIESIDDLRIENEDYETINTRDKIYLKETSYDAIIAAFNEANINYEIKSIDVYVTYIFEEANTNIKVGDIIKKVNDKDIINFEDLKSTISNYKPNDKVIVKVLRDNKEVECYAYLFLKDNDLMMGITLAEIKDVITTPNVTYIFKNNESGSSRGFMCALDIYNKITEYDLTKGKKIAGTGSIDAEGNIGKIDGVKYKLKGAVNKKADVFIVPYENYDEAIKIKEKNNYNIQIIKSSTLKEAIEKLKELD